MAGFVQDGYIHTIAKFLINAEALIKEKYNGTLNFKDELVSLNNRFGFVQTEFFDVFFHDVMNSYVFHKERHAFSISHKSMISFKYHGFTDPLAVLRQDLINELNAIPAQ